MRPGLTGDQCDQACPYHPSDPYSCLELCSDSDCQLGTSCKQTADACHCIDGYSGRECNLCNPVELPDVCGSCGGGAVVCQNDALCDMSLSTCTCKTGYLNSDCGYCDPMDHSNRCLEHCMYECKAGYCDTRIEACRCPKSYSGHDCSMCDPEMNPEQCAPACNGIVCMNDGLCNITKRECACAPGYYGNGCLNICSFECINDGYCDTHSKRCVCPLGYLGEDCSVCDPAIHLDNCTSHCPHSCINNSTCDSLTGVCECLPGWSGHACHEPCTEGFFGKKCSNPCTCKGWPCDHITGECFIETTTLLTTTVLTTTEERQSTQAPMSFLRIIVYCRPIESPSVILLLAFLAAIFLVLIILSALLYARKHYKRNHFSQPDHVELPLNNIVVIPIPSQDQGSGEPEFVAANTPLVESENTEEHISNSFRRPKDAENASIPLMKPNPRKSTNLDVDAQRFYTKEAGQNLDNFSKLPKGIKLNRNIFNEKEALNKDKFKNSNYEEPIDVKCVSLAGDDDLKKEVSENWNAEPSDGATGGYEKLASGSEEDSGNSDSEAKGKRNFPIYAQVDFDERDKSSEYQHLGHSFDREAETGDPSYSRLGITVPKGTVN
ncbi:hypothetical protein BSL78_05202 [Apostichopus japonicus]|uniref:EGF-like domain-containing protein n=1 Tax=Stichopus japonicus TaxID=307972 RepID=A0A2G8LCE6_STIJA|nr:hypothetical protein BSL78_05202 [Apostichopus japonicus]